MSKVTKRPPVSDRPMTREDNGLTFQVPHAVEPRVFRLIKNLGAYEPSKKGGADIGGCDHMEYVLDERWSKVNCGGCGIELQAFDVLKRYEEYEGRLRHEKEAAWHAEQQLLVGQLRIFYRQRRFTEEEKATMKPYLVGGYRYPAEPPKELRELVRALDRKAGAP